MISRYAVWLNDVSLAEVDPRIYVSDISYPVPTIERKTSRLAGRDGLYSGDSEYIKERKISITFVVREYSTQRRQEIIQNVILWASNGGWLKTSDRVGQKIYVKATGLPAATSVMRWLDELAVEFTSFDYPYWQDEAVQEITLANNALGTLYLPGVRDACVEASILAQESITSYLNIQCGDTQIIIGSPGMAENDIVTIGYSEDHHIMDIKLWTVSILNKRLPTSDDDLIAKPGNNTVTFAADGAALCTLTVRGVYL